MSIPRYAMDPQRPARRLRAVRGLTGARREIVKISMTSAMKLECAISEAYATRSRMPLTRRKNAIKTLSVSTFSVLKRSTSS